jgi:hypothetical protein
MMFEGLKRKSNSITLELLTRSQLELVCQKNFRKKNANGNNNNEELINRQSVTSSLKDDLNQRYLDMVYHVEYDTYVQMTLLQ